MKERLALSLLLFTLMACTSPPNRPGSLWDDLPPTESDAAKTVPAQSWEPPAAPDVPSPGDVGGDPSIPAVTGTVVLNEIFYDSADSDTDGNLFVELYGTPELPLGGFKVNFVNGSDGRIYDAITIPAGEKIRDDGFYLIADSKVGAATVSNVAGADLIDNFDPQNGPDAVQLVDASGGLVDAVGYGAEIVAVAGNGLASFEGSPAPDVTGGHSLERKVPGVDTGDNASDFLDLEEPTPGESHPQPVVPDLPVPESESDAGDGEDTVPGEAPEGGSDGEVVLNEIYYDAVGVDTDGVVFIELYGEPSLDVEGYRIHLIDGADGSIDDVITLPSEARLGEDGYYVIADAKTGSAFETNVPNADFVDSFDPANGPDAVQLLDSEGSLRDAVGYGEGVFGPAENGLDDFEGVPAPDPINGHSLERVSPGLDFNDNFSDFVDREVPTPGT